MLALFWALGGTKYVKCSMLKLEQRSAHIMGPEKKTMDDSNPELPQNACHISYCVTESELCTLKTAYMNP